MCWGHIGPRSVAGPRARGDLRGCPLGRLAGYEFRVRIGPYLRRLPSQDVVRGLEAVGATSPPSGLPSTGGSVLWAYVGRLGDGIEHLGLLAGYAQFVVDCSGMVMCC